MRTDLAIEHAGSAKALADLLGITPSAVSQWGENVPQPRQWQLKVLRPEWFPPSPDTGHRRRATDHPRATDAAGTEGSITSAQ